MASNIEFYKEGTASGSIEIDVYDDVFVYQASFKDAAGDVTITVLPHVEEQNGVKSDPNYQPVTDGVVTFTGGLAEPVLICGVFDKIKFECSGSFTYFLTGIRP